MTAKPNGMTPHPASPVTVSLQDLQDGTVPFSALEAAFGPSSLGILLISHLPPSFTHLRSRLLSYSSHLASLSSDQLSALEDASSHYLVGWSRGKETLKDGRYDTLKGSYYANPVSHPPTEQKARELFPTLPEYTAPNVWPDESVLPGFRAAFEELCTLIVDTAVLVAKACDTYAAAKVPDYRPGYLERVVRSSVSTKARLLHYFPAESTDREGKGQADEDDDWCATHLDHGCLTGLTSAMFVDEASCTPAGGAKGAEATDGFLPTLPELPSSPDPKAGLYIHSREGEVTKVAIPRDCLAFQTGSALEAITRGKFKAVPHFVRGVRAGGGEGQRVARNTIAVFTQPNLWEVVDQERGLDFASFAKEIVERNH